MNQDSNTPRAVIAVIIALGLVLLSAGLFLTTPSPAASLILTGLLSALTLALGQVIGYYFGSSAGAKNLVANQNENMKTLTTAVANSAPVPNADPIKPAGTPDDPVAVAEVKPDWATTKSIDVHLP